MSIAPGPFVDVDLLIAAPVPELPNFVKGTDIKGNVVHMASAHIVMIISGPNYNTFHMTSGHNIQIAGSVEVSQPPATLEEPPP